MTACEVYPPMIKLAEQLIVHNQLTSAVQIHAKRSDELSVCTGKPVKSHPLPQAASAPSPHPTGQPSYSEQHCSKAGSTMTSSAAKRLKHARQQEDYAAAIAGSSSSSNMILCKADVIVTEIFDSELIGEGILPTMRHAVKHLLQVCLLALLV